jgi:hypothetical protein
MTPDQRMDALLTAEADGRLPGFVLFWGDEPGRAPVGPWVLSQWWAAPFDVDGVTYPTAEHWMMAEKARLSGDEDSLALILAAEHPGEAKALGREVAPFDSDRWDAVRYDVVVRGNLAKFTAHDDLRAYLLSTAPKALVEASPVDRVWGVGWSARDVEAQRPSAWRGSNLLGFALMDVRERLA